MGPLWAWVGLWLVSLYGLVFLLRSAMARSVVEPVPVLVATPKTTEEAPQEPLGPAAEPEATVPEGEVLVGTVPEGLTGEAESPALAPADEVLAAEDGLTSLPPEEPSLEPVLPKGDEAEPGAADSPKALEEPETAGQTLGEDPAELGMAPPASEEPEPLEPGSPEAPLAVEPETLDPGTLEVPGDEAPHPLVQENPEAPVSEEVVALDGDALGEVAMAEDEPVVYRAIDLESLTLGLQASEIQERYGAPGHMAKLGEDGEQWRYPLNATDDRGHGLEGVLVLEFQRGRLVRKALEEAGEG